MPPGATCRLMRMDSLKAYTRTGNDSFDLYFSIAPVVIIYGDGRNFHADEYRHSVKLLKALDDLGARGVRIRGIICPAGAATISSIRALNCYLRHGGLALLKRSKRSYFGYNKFNWFDLVEVVGIQFVR